MAIATPEWGDLIGVPFARGGRGPENYDCYGLATEMQRRWGRNVPDFKSPATHEEIASLIDQNIPFWRPCERKPGAVIAIRLKHVIDGRVVSLVSHVATVIEEDRLIHTWQKSGGVVTEPIEHWTQRIVGYYEFPQ